jgi:hypothetical protein
MFVEHVPVTKNNSGGDLRLSYFIFDSLSLS